MLLGKRDQLFKNKVSIPEELDTDFEAAYGLTTAESGLDPPSNETGKTAMSSAMAGYQLGGWIGGIAGLGYGLVKGQEDYDTALGIYNQKIADKEYEENFADSKVRSQADPNETIYADKSPSTYGKFGINIDVDIDSPYTDYSVIDTDIDEAQHGLNIARDNFIKARTAFNGKKKSQDIGSLPKAQHGEDPPPDSFKNYTSAETIWERDKHLFGGLDEKKSSLPNERVSNFSYDELKNHPEFVSYTETERVEDLKERGSKEDVRRERAWVKKQKGKIGYLDLMFDDKGSHIPTRVEVYDKPKEQSVLMKNPVQRMTVEELGLKFVKPKRVKYEYVSNAKDPRLMKQQKLQKLYDINQKHRKYLKDNNLDVPLGKGVWTPTRDMSEENDKEYTAKIEDFLEKERKLVQEITGDEEMWWLWGRGDNKGMEGLDWVGKVNMGAKTQSIHYRAKTVLKPSSNIRYADPEIVAKQKTLKDAGLYKGELDGIWGKGSQKAWEIFNEKYDMIPSGGNTFYKEKGKSTASGKVTVAEDINIEDYTKKPKAKKEVLSKPIEKKPVPKEEPKIKNSVRYTKKGPGLHQSEYQYFNEEGDSSFISKGTFDALKEKPEITDLTKYKHGGTHGIKDKDPYSYEWSDAVTTAGDVASPLKNIETSEIAPHIQELIEQEEYLEKEQLLKEGKIGYEEVYASGRVEETASPIDYLVGSGVLKLGAKGLKGLYNTVATGNSAIPIAWKSGLGTKGTQGFKAFDELVGTNLSAADAKIVADYMLAPKNFLAGSKGRIALEKIIKKNPSIAQRINSPISRIEGYTGGKKSISTKYGSQPIKYDRDRAWTVGELSKTIGSPGYYQRIVIPQKYAKNMGDKFFKIPYKESKNLRKSINANEQQVSKLYAEKELLGNPNLKVIGRSKDKHYENIIVKPTREIPHFKHGGSLPKAQNGNGDKTIYVSDPNDPRLKAYKDSLYNFNIGERLKGVMAPISRTSGPGSAGKKFPIFMSEEESKYWEENEGKAYYKIPHTYWDTGEELPYWRTIQDNIENAREEGHGLFDNTEVFEKPSNWLGVEGDYPEIDALSSIVDEYRKKGHKGILPEYYDHYRGDFNAIESIIKPTFSFNLANPSAAASITIPQWKEPKQKVVYQGTEPKGSKVWIDLQGNVRTDEPTPTKFMKQKSIPVKKSTPTKLTIGKEEFEKPQQTYVERESPKNTIKFIKKGPGHEKSQWVYTNEEGDTSFITKQTFDTMKKDSSITDLTKYKRGGTVPSLSQCYKDFIKAKKKHKN